MLSLILPVFTLGLRSPAKFLLKNTIINSYYTVPLVVLLYESPIRIGPG